MKKKQSPTVTASEVHVLNRTPINKRRKNKAKKTVHDLKEPTDFFRFFQVNPLENE